MRKHWMIRITAVMGAAVLAASLLTACGKKQDQTNEQVPTPEELVEQANEITENPEEIAEQAEAIKEEALADFTGEMDLEGSWEDEVSQRASMDVTRNDDGSYDIYVHWGSSATETAIWEIHGTYDAVGGMLSYDDGAFSIHTWDSEDKETVSGEETTTGAFLKEGDKLRWSDSKNTDDGLFVKMQ